MRAPCTGRCQGLVMWCRPDPSSQCTAIVPLVNTLLKRLLLYLVADASVLYSPALQDMALVGWYHSHPSSQCDPSLTDITSQVAQQAAHRTAEGCEPYIAAIVGPFSRQTSQAHSNITWFSVERVSAGPAQAGDHNAVTGCVPMQLEVS